MFRLINAGLVQSGVRGARGVQRAVMVGASRERGDVVRSFSASAAAEHDASTILSALDLAEENSGVFDGTWEANGDWTDVVNPHNCEVIARVQTGTMDDYERVIGKMTEAQAEWQSMPMPARGEIVREIGNGLREKLTPLGELVSLEVGKIRAEGIGEVQEYIDMCDYAVGLSRQLQGKVLPSERPGHSMLEQWNPLGPTAVITAYNFPVAVFGWNSSVSMVCGNTTVWKPSPTTPLTGIAVTKIIASVLEKHGVSPAVSCLAAGGIDIGEAMSSDPRLPLVSFTGSTAIGRKVGVAVAERFGNSILELGGNNALIVHEDADLDLALNAVVFGSVGTSGQRCTTTRRLMLHESIADEFMERLLHAYKQVRVGDPLDEASLLGPVHSEKAVEIFEGGLKEIAAQGGEILCGGQRLTEDSEGNPLTGYYVAPAVTRIAPDAPIVQEELFVPILHTMTYATLDEAIAWNNSVKQGLSSSLFSKSSQNLFQWMGPNGSDCGIVNTNLGTSGAEIGGAFGGQKETGGGREAGSDAWKQYMRRSTCTINHSDELPLAQGISFDL